MLFRALFAFVLLVSTTACIELPPLFPEEEEPKFNCVGTCVSGLKLSLPKGRLWNGPLPQATSTGVEPVVTSAQWVYVTQNVFGIELDVDTQGPVTAVYLEINGSVYVFDPVALESGGAADINACNILAEQQGYSCTQACLDACACVSCNDEAIESNLVNSCAVNCSIYSHQGAIGPEPYTSEAVFADIVYNGYTNGAGTVPGMLQSIDGCSGQVCSDQAPVSQEKPKRVRIDFYRQDTSFLSNFNTGNLVAESQPADSPVVSSPAGAPAQIRTGGNCDPAACR